MKISKAVHCVPLPGIAQGGGILTAALFALLFIIFFLIHLDRTPAYFIKAGIL